MYRIWYNPFVGKKPKSATELDVQSEAVERQGKRVPAIFFRTDAGGEPVRDWLKSMLSSEDRQRIGEDIKTVEFGWPSACRFADRWAMLSMRCGRPWARIVSRACFFTSTRRAGWFCCTDSSRKRERLPPAI